MALSPNWTYDDHSGTGGLPGTRGYWESGKNEDLKENYGPENASITRLYFVQWADRFAFIDDLLGYSILDGTNTIKRTLPDSLNIVANFYAVDAAVSPYGQMKDPDPLSTAYPDTVLAKIEATYKFLDFAVKADADVTSELDRYITRQFEFQTEYMETGPLRYVSTKNLLTARLGKQVQRIGINYIWHEVPGKTDNPWFPPNWLNIRQALGTINSAYFDVNNLNAAPGTLLFAGIEPKLMTPKLGSNQVFWEISVKFMFTANLPVAPSQDSIAGWNYGWNVQMNYWDKTTFDGSLTGTAPFQTSNFNNIFIIT